ncbi:MAG: MotA/TolQ/ExbB proton channel family protein [Candidatus Marinimicrobia bacterium]|nr:MotA/TolQ/ExbB proton channel family protein [Candidatus Neomarinimicrobiota bacterium]
MIHFILNGGPLAIVQVLLTVLLVVLLTQLGLKLIDRSVAFDILQLSIRKIRACAALVLALGVLGQVQGIFNALSAISKATEISPQVCLEGILVSFHTTLLGLWVFVFTYFAMNIMNLFIKKS